MLLFKLLSTQTPVIPPVLPDYDVGFVDGVWTNNSTYTQSGSIPIITVDGKPAFNCTNSAYITLNGHPMTAGDWTACFDVQVVNVGDMRIVSTNTAARLMSLGASSVTGYNLSVFSTDDNYHQPQNFPVTNGQRFKAVLKCKANVGYYLSTTTSSNDLLISPSMFSGNGFCLGYGYGAYQYYIHDFKLYDQKLLTDEQINQYLA